MNAPRLTPYKGLMIYSLNGLLAECQLLATKPSDGQKEPFVANCPLEQKRDGGGEKEELAGRGNWPTS